MTNPLRNPYATIPAWAAIGMTLAIMSPRPWLALVAIPVWPLVDAWH